jgi:hypothetical protein
LAEQAQEHVRAVVSRFARQPDADIRAHTVAEMAAAFVDAPLLQASSTTPA